jgi:hypothetical protein
MRSAWSARHRSSGAGPLLEGFGVARTFDRDLRFGFVDVATVVVG